MRLGSTYQCNWCKRRLSDRGVGEDHISLPIGSGGGKASCTGPLPGWRIRKRVEAGWYHFCGGNCMMKFFDTVLDIEYIDFVELLDD